MHTHVRPALGAITAAGTLTLLGLAGAAQADAAPALAHLTHRTHPVIAYIADNGGNMVTPVNTTTGTTLSPIRVGRGPYNIVFTPNGKTAYVSISGGVVPVNTSTHKAEQLIKNVFSGMFGAPVMAPNGKTLYDFGNGGSSVIPISTATNKAGKPIKFEFGENAMAITPDGKTLYFASSWGFVSPINTATRKAGKAIIFTSEGVSDTGIWIAMAPDGKTVYVSGALDGTVTPISMATNKPGKPIGAREGALYITPNGRTAYVVVPAGGPPGSCASVTSIDTATKRIGKTITIRAAGLSPSFAITPDSKTAYATCDRTGSRGQQLRGFVIPISTATNKAGKAIKVGHNPSAITIKP